MTKIRGIAEIVLNVRDVEASLKFYQETLGLEIWGYSVWVGLGHKGSGR